MDQTPGDAVRAAIAEALAMTDPARRATAITQILGSVQDNQPTLKDARQADVLALRESMTRDEVAELIGTTYGRIAQIESGFTKRKPPTP